MYKLNNKGSEESKFLIFRKHPELLFPVKKKKSVGVKYQAIKDGRWFENYNKKRALMVL